MATILKNPALVHTASPPKKQVDNHVSLELTNDSVKFKDASLLKKEVNRVLLTPVITNQWSIIVIITSRSINQSVSQR